MTCGTVLIRPDGAFLIQVDHLSYYHSSAELATWSM